jgi:O-antigen/teichoic acid export membrane protein
MSLTTHTTRHGDKQQPPHFLTPEHAAGFSRLAKNSVANLLRLGAGWIVLLIVPPLLVHLLDRASYATWMLVLQIAAYASLFDGGLQLAIARYVARAQHSSEPDFLARFLSSAAALLIVAATVICAFVVVVSLNLGSIFHSIPGPIVRQAATALALVGGSIAIAIPSAVFAGLYLGLENNKVVAVIGSLSKIAGACGTLWAAFHHQGLVRMAVWTAIGILLQPALFFFSIRRAGFAALLRIRLVSLRLARRFCSFCAAMIASQFSMLLISGLDLPIVAAFDFRNAGYYALAAAISNMLVVPHGAVLSTIVPMMSNMSAGQPTELMGRALLRTTRLATALLAVIAAPLMLGMPVLLRLWVGETYAQRTLLFAELLVAAQLVRLTMMPYALIGFSAGEQRRMLVSPTVEGVVNIVCSVALVRAMGAAGVAVGTLIGAIVGVILHFCVSMPRTRSVILARSILLWQGIARPIGWALPPAVVCALLLPLCNNIAARLLLLSATFAALCWVLWRWHLDSIERAAVRTIVVHLLPFSAGTKPVGA